MKWVRAGLPAGLLGGSEVAIYSKSSSSFLITKKALLHRIDTKTPFLLHPLSPFNFSSL